MPRFSERGAEAVVGAHGRDRLAELVQGDRGLDTAHLGPRAHLARHHVHERLVGRAGLAVEHHGERRPLDRVARAEGLYDVLGGLRQADDRKAVALVEPVSAAKGVDGRAQLRGGQRIERVSDLAHRLDGDVFRLHDPRGGILPPVPSRPCQDCPA